MFNKHKYKFISLATLVVLVGVALPTQYAHAQLIGMITMPAIMMVLSVIASALFHVVGFLLTMTGGLLNISINLTLHIKDFVQSTAGVYLVWQTIRDVSGMLIIFLLLYTSFRMILGIDKGMSKLIKDIIIAGILINFSFFLVGLLIDASNVISLSVFNTIAPAQSATCNVASGNFSNCSVSSMFDSSTYDGGISSIIMQNLHVTSIFSTQWMNLNPVSAVADQFRILFIQEVGIMVMLMTAISFLAAAIAFVVRLVMLIFILAFSPIWFASWIFPEMKPLSEKFEKGLKGQLVFMPVYLFLLYAAIKIIETMNLTSTTISSQASVTAIAQSLLSIMINSTFVIIMINLPLMGAISVSGMSGSWLDKMTSSIKTKTSSFIGRNTLGRAASRINESDTMKNIYANNKTLGRWTQTGFSKVSSAGFGGGKKEGFDDVRKGRVEARKKFADSLGYNEEEVKKFKGNIEEKRRELSGMRFLRDQSSDPEDRKRQEEKIAQKEEEVKKLLGGEYITTIKEDDPKREEKIAKIIDDAGKNERKNKVYESYMKESLAGKVAGNIPLVGKYMKGPNKFNKMTADAIRKKKPAINEIIEAVQAEMKKDGDKGGGGGSERSDKPKGDKSA